MSPLTVMLIRRPRCSATAISTFCFPLCRATNEQRIRANLCLALRPQAHLHYRSNRTKMTQLEPQHFETEDSPICVGLVTSVSSRPQTHSLVSSSANRFLNTS